MSYREPQYEPWPVDREEPEPDPRTWAVLSLDLELTRAEYARVATDLSAIQAMPNLDPQTRYVLSYLGAKFRTKAAPKEPLRDSYLR